MSHFHNAIIHMCTHTHTHTLTYMHSILTYWHITCIWFSVANSEFGVELVHLGGRAGGWGSSWNSLFFILASRIELAWLCQLLCNWNKTATIILYLRQFTSLSCSEWNACADSNIPSLVWRFWMLACRASSWPLKLLSVLTSCCVLLSASTLLWVPSISSFRFRLSFSTEVSGVECHLSSELCQCSSSAVF